MRLSAYVVLLLCCLNVSLPAQRDTAYVELFDNQARINTGLRYRESSLTISAPSRDELHLESTGLSFRIGGRFKRVSYTFSLPLSDLGTGTDERESEKFGLGLTLFLRRQLVSGRFRRIRGFRAVTAGGTGTFREDVELITATVFGYHVLNHEKFSLRAGFRQRDRQLKSQGSFLIGGLADRQILTTDEKFIPFADGRDKWISRLAQTKFGVGVGYAHTFTFGNHFFVTPFALVGPEIRFLSVNDANGGRRERESVRISPRVRGYLAVGWNGERTAAAITVHHLPSFDVSDNLTTRREHLTVELRITRRLFYPD